MEDSQETLDIADLTSGAGSRLGSGIRVIAPARKVVVIPLARNRQFSTHGNAIASPKWYPVGPRALIGFGPAIEDIVGHGVGKDFTTNFNWEMTTEKSTEGDGWNTNTSLVISVQTSAVGVISSAYSTRTEFALQMRFVIGVGNGSGSAIELGNITCYAAIRFWA